MSQENLQALAAASASPQRLADYVAAFVAAQGVKTVFMVPGGGAMFLIDAFGRSTELDYVPNHHEQASSIAAEAYSRINGRLGCAVVTTGPGATNAITGCAGAWIESVPLLIISGQVKRADLIGASGVRQMGPQEVEIVSMVTPITKYAVTVLEPNDIRYHLEKSVHLATTGRRGPVWLDIPLDVQNAAVDAGSLRGFEHEPAATRKISIEDEARAVLDAIQRAERPLILAGQGIRLAGAAAAFRELCEILGAPVVTTWNAMDLVPASHLLSVGKPGTVALRAPNFAVQNCDLLLAIGARLDNVVTAYNPKKFARSAKKIVVDVDPAELAKFPDDSGIDRKIEADAMDFIDALLRLARKAPKRDFGDWLARCAEWKRKYPLDAGKPFPSSGRIGHFHLTKALSDVLPEQALIVTGSSGLGVEFFYTGFDNKEGQRIFLTSGLGAMGYGMPAMIGAYMASDRRPFFGVESDGSLMMNLQEMQTIASLKLPLRMFVINNRGYASIRNTQRNYFDGRYVGTGPEAKLDLPDFPQLARAFGWDAFVIEDAADLAPGVAHAVAHQGGPLLIDVRVIENEALFPKSAALFNDDGSILSMPLEDMSPLLPRAEFRANMIAPLDPASENIPAHLLPKG